MPCRARRAGAGVLCSHAREMPRPCFSETASLRGHTNPMYSSHPIQSFLNVPSNQISGEKPSHWVHFSSSQPGWRTQSCPASSHTQELCSGRSISTAQSPWEEHHHCSRYPISNSLLLRRNQHSRAIPAVPSPPVQRRGKETPPKPCRWEQLSQPSLWGKLLLGEELWQGHHWLHSDRLQGYPCSGGDSWLLCSSCGTQHVPWIHIHKDI